MGLSQHKSPKSFTSLYAFSRTLSDVLCTFRRFHNFIFHQSARWVYLGPGVNVGSARKNTFENVYRHIDESRCNGVKCPRLDCPPAS